jgi:hypothetical protein
MKRIFVFVPVVVLSLVSSGLLLAQSMPQAGTWKLNVAKSKYANGNAPKSEIRKVVPQGDGAKYTFKGVAADGSPIDYTFVTHYDGKDAPISGVGSSFGADTIAVTRPDARTTIGTDKKAGKAMGTLKVVVSEDGKVTMSTTTTPDGKVLSTTVWEKQ